VTRLLHVSDLEGALDRPERVARLAGLIAELNGPDALVCGSGDNTGPGVVSLATRGRAALELFDAIGLDVETWGNHDLDYGLDSARALATDATATAAALAADETVGVTGVLDPRTPEMSPAAGALAATDPIEAVGRAVGRLHATTDRLVVLSHTGRDAALAGRFDVDAVLGGHVHEERADRVAGTLHSQPGQNGRVVMEVDLDAGTVVRHPVASATPVPEVRRAFERLRTEAGLDEAVARVDEPVDRTGEHTRDGECRAGNFVADAYRWAADADCALHNAGGLRSGPPLSGAVTVADLVSLVPFNESVAVCELTGRELRALCEEAYCAPHGEFQWIAHVAGMSVRYDTGARELRSLRVDSEPVVDGRSYRLATNAYLCQAPHEFPTLTPDHRIERLDTQYEVLASYARENGIAPECEGRIRLE